MDINKQTNQKEKKEKEENVYAKWVRKQKNKQANPQIKKQTCMKVNNSKEKATPTPKLTVHRPDHMKWYFQCSHRCIGQPMLAHWSTHVGEGMVHEPDKYANEQTRKI